MIDLAANLLKKYNQDNLAQVYLAKYPEQACPIMWAKNFINEITPLADHPDILWIDRGVDNVYKVDSSGILALNKFLNYRAFELKKKFIFINDAHLMSVIVSNKLLKVFEELPENFCLFLFAPQDQNLLPTVESRAIKILLPENLPTVAHDELPQQYASAQELMTSLKKSDNAHLEEKHFIEESLKKILRNANYADCSQALINLQHYQISEDFNNSKLSRLALFFK